MRTLIFLLALTAPIAGIAENLQDSLKKEYEHQVLSLRGPFQEGHLEFDSMGKPLTGPPRGEWVMYGPIQIKKISLHADNLVLEGPLVAPSKNPTPLGKPIQVKIRLDRSIRTVDDAHAVLDRVFSLDPKKTQYRAPEFRRREETIEPTEKVYHVQPDHVTAPRAIFMPDPDFSLEARKAKYQGDVVLGAVIDKTGRVSRITIQRVLGMGLDEKAVEKLKTWRFEPSLREGQPVAVEVSVEVSFKLY